MRLQQNPVLFSLVLVCLVLQSSINKVICEEIKIVSSKSDLASVTMTETNDFVSVENGFIKISFNKKHPSIDKFFADFLGGSKFENNLMSQGLDRYQLFRKGIILQRSEWNKGYPRVINYFSSSRQASPLQYADIISNNAKRVELVIRNVFDDVNHPLMVSDWNITLNQGDRFASITIEGSAVEEKDICHSKISILTSQESVFGLFHRGVEQMMNGNKNPYFASKNPLFHFYTIGMGGSVGVSTQNTNIIMISNDYPVEFYSSGLEFSIAGDFPVYDQWYHSWEDEERRTKVHKSFKFRKEFQLYGKNFYFPSKFANNWVSKMNFEDSKLMYTSIYGSAVGTLASYKFDGKGLVRTGLNFPDFSYSPLYSFFDPDSYMQVVSLLYSAEPYLISQARYIIENTMNHIKNETGHVPHHFNNTTPQYEAISGAIQTGPNMFWIEAALMYVKLTGDILWLEKNMVFIRKALSYLLSLYDPQYKLIKTTGSLFLDTLIRFGFTSDSNAMFVKVLQDVSKAEKILGNHQQWLELQKIKQSIIEGMNDQLWLDDHYITEKHLDGSQRDFIDYDANLLAVAWNISDNMKSKLILDRIDSNPCTHPRGGTWVSERYYDKNNTYHSWEDDSAVTLARIAWIDALSRKRMNQSDVFFNNLYYPLRDDVNRFIWIAERYNCNGIPTRHLYYHEFPEVALMMMREVLYGIEFDFDQITINPISFSNFFFSDNAGLLIDFQENSIEIFVTRIFDTHSEQKFLYSIGNLLRNCRYQVRYDDSEVVLQTDQQGFINFFAPFNRLVKIKKI